MSHLIIMLGCAKLILDLAICILNAAARIFNMLLLYLISPLAISTSPMDDGGKFKQWKTAFIIQAFGILGVVVAMRLLILYLPLIANADLRLFENPIMNMLGKLLLVLGGSEAAKRANGLITGILADNAGMQSIAAGDMSQMAEGAVHKAKGLAEDVTGVSGAKQRVGEKWKQMAERGGVAGVAANKLSGGKLGQTSEERSAVRNRDFQKKMDKWDKKDDNKGGAAGTGSSGGSSGKSSGGTSTGSTSTGSTSGDELPQQQKQVNDAPEYSKVEVNQAPPSEFEQGSKQVPPTDSDQYNAKYSPTNQVNNNSL